MSLMHRVTVYASLLVLVAWQAEAQTDSTISVGADYGVDMPRSSALKRTEGFGVAFRLPRPEAEALMVQAFVGEAMELIENEELREALNGIAESWLQARTKA